MTTLFQNIQTEIKKLEADAGADLSALEAKIKALFETHAVSALETKTAATPTPEAAVAVAQVLSTAPAAPTTAEPPKSAA